MGGRGATSSNTNTQSVESFIKDIVDNYNEFTRGDLQGAVEAYAMQTGRDDEELLREIDRRANGTTNQEVKDLYDFINSKNDRFTTIGANSKNFDRVINNAKSIELIDNDLPDGRTRATKEDIRRDLQRFGRSGKNGMKMNYSRNDDEFVLAYYYGYQYRIKVR